MRTKKKIQEPWHVDMAIVREELVITLVNKNTGEIRQNKWTKEEAAIFCFGIKNLQNLSKGGDVIIA